MKRVPFEVINHGYTQADYFQGCGTAYTRFDVCYTGAGMNAREAYDDALDQVYQDDFPTHRRNEILSSLPKRPRGIRKRDSVPMSHRGEGSECYWYVSIRLVTRGDK